MTAVALRGFFNVTAYRASAAPAGGRLEPMAFARVTRNAWTKGNGRVAGTVKEHSSPADLPLRRKVQLFSLRDSRLYGETWSDATTGAYSFDYIDETIRYFVVAFDHLGNYNAVIKDQITPEPMP